MSHDAGESALLTEQTRELLKRIIARLRRARRVQVVGHVRPDGDCIGSVLAMHHLLTGFGVEHRLAAGQLRANGFGLLPGFDGVRETPDPAFDPDLMVFVDCGDLERALPGAERPPVESINIDHHGSNTGFADVNWVEPRCAAVGEMLYYLLRDSGEPLTPDLANTLLLAIVTDTGSLRFSNVAPRHFKICAELIEAGACVDLINRVAFENQSPQTIAMIGEVLAGTRYECGGKIAWGELRRKAIDRHGGDDHVPGDMGNELRSIRGVEVAMMFIEPAAGGLRVSLRSRGGVDVSRLASEFGGGGHPNAAGISVTGRDYDAARDSILGRACQVIGDLLPDHPGA